MKSIEVFEKIVDAHPHIERKGKTVPYTSANGYMFCFVNKAGKLGIRLPKEAGKAFVDQYQTPPFMSHGAKMREYVLIPESLYEDIGYLTDLIQQGYEHVMSLKPK